MHCSTRERCVVHASNSNARTRLNGASLATQVSLLQQPISALPTRTKPNDDGGWCSEPLEHFDIARPVFEKIAEYNANMIPVSYRRVPCDNKEGGMKFTLTGNPHYTEVLVWNVAGADVNNLKVKTEDSNKWLLMERTWGQLTKEN